MANITPVITFANGTDDRDGWLLVWGPMANGDVGVTYDPLFVGFADRSVQVDGTFGAGFNLSWEGSNDGVHFHTLRDPFNNILNITIADIYEVLQICMLCRPRVTSGDGTTSVTASAVFKRTKS